MLAVVMMCFIVLSSLAQTAKRTVITQPNNYPASDSISAQNGNMVPTEMRAVTIVSISVEGKQIAVGEPFEASKDWLKGLAVELKNISGIPIRSIRLHFSLPETRANGTPSGFSLEYGRDLSARFEKTEKPLIAPGENIQISRSETHYKLANEGIEKRTGLSDFSEVVLVNATVKFDNGVIWSSHRLPFADDKERPESVLDASTNLIRSLDDPAGMSVWKMTGEASIEKATNDSVFILRNGASFSQDVAVPSNSDGKFALLISRCSSERLDDEGITGLPTLYGRWMSGTKVEDQPLQGQRMLCELGEVNKWATNWGIFKIPAAASAIKLYLNQAERKGMPQNGSSARFSNVGLYIFDTEADAMKFVIAFSDSYR